MAASTAARYSTSRPAAHPAMPGTTRNTSTAPLAIPPFKRGTDASERSPKDGRRAESPDLLFDMSPEDTHPGGEDGAHEDNRSLHTRIAAHRRDSGLVQHAPVPSIPSSIFQNAASRSYQHPRHRGAPPPSSSYYPGANGTPQTQPAEPPLMYSFPTFRLSTRETVREPRYGALRPRREPSPPFAPAPPPERPEARRRRSSSSESTSSLTGSSKRASADTSAATSISASPEPERGITIARAGAGERPKGSAETLSPAGLSAALRRTHLGSAHVPRTPHSPRPPSGLGVELGTSHRARPTQWSSRANISAEHTSEWVKVSGTPPQSVRSRAAQELERLSRGWVR